MRPWMVAMVVWRGCQGEELTKEKQETEKIGGLSLCVTYLIISVFCEEAQYTGAIGSHRMYRLEWENTVQVEMKEKNDDRGGAYIL